MYIYIHSAKISQEQDGSNIFAIIKTMCISSQKAMVGITRRAHFESYDSITYLIYQEISWLDYPSSELRYPGVGEFLSFLS